MLKSELHTYSLAICLEDKKPGSDILVVQPTEALTNKSGDLTKYTHKHGDIVGDNRIEAMWHNFSDVRETAPDIVIGEKVMLLRYENTDMYYWYSFGRSNPLRRLEHIQWMLSNTEKRAEEAKPDNQLFFIASTRDGYLQVITPQNRKEKALYDIKLNFKKGKYTFTDKNGGSFSWDAVSGKIHLVAKQVLWDVPKITFNGNVKITKGLHVGGHSTLAGGAKVIGRLTVKGVIKTFGVIYAYLYKHL